jgi:hypothetical protein
MFRRIRPRQTTQTAASGSIPSRSLTAQRSFCLQVARVDAGAGGLLPHRYRNRLLSGANTVLLQVRVALVKDPNLYPVIHRHLSLDARLVDHNLARLHVEGHLPSACWGLLGRGSLGLELPERVLLEEIA